MAFRVLNPELTRYLLNGEVDELTPQNTARIDRIKATPCPRCGASLHPKIRDDAPFSEHSPLPQLLATCECGYAVDYASGIILDRGSAAKVKDPLPILDPQKDG